MAATIRDVARRAAVSISTVSGVINRSKPVSAELRERVEAAIRELDYIPNARGRALSLKRSSMLAYVIPTITNPFFTTMIQAVEKTALEHGYGLIMCSSEDQLDRSKQYRKFLLSTQVDGVLLTLAHRFPLREQYEPFLKRNIPVVAVAGAESVQEIDCVVTDDERGIDRLVRYLLGLGHRRIAFVGRSVSHSSTVRLAAVRKSLAAAGLDVPPAYVKLLAQYTESLTSRGQIKELLECRSRPTAVVCANDVMAVSVIRVCHELGLAVPGDVTVTGYDDSLSQLTSPGLTTLRVPTDVMGRRAAELLIRRINAETPPPPDVLCYEPELVVRESSGPPPE